MKSSQMTLVSHLEELRRRLLVVAGAVVLGAIVCWIFYPQILDFLLRPYCQVRLTMPSSSVFGQSCELLVTDPLEPFGVRMTVAGYGGVALAMPVILWQLWRFVAPGLYPKERRWAVPFVLSGMVLFVSGMALAYWSIPRALDFLVSIGGPDLVSVFSPAKYLGFVVKMTIAFGIGFEFPLVLIMLQMVGILSNKVLRKNRRFAIVGIVALVAVLTPSGDPFTLLVLSVPMIIFYEAAILFGRLRDRRQRRVDE
ncbi:MAG TPA: twin-arginine translocase subunit TatC [Acidimicrobiia bacterium]|jgi:sec-independent protein translocase protein TatC|nr:twin-arginine translocase subunit TatC [Acidimicrobiia bacterium]HIL47017.1 twin-arginine translocase subunit TatC [Acidimicrobiia bacterium]